MRDRLIAFLIAVTIAVVFRGVLANEFILIDDDLHITNNPYLTSEPKSLSKIWAEPYQGLYIPVTYSVWALQKAALERFWAVSHPGPVPKSAAAPFFHLVNLGLHVLNALLVYFLLRSLALADWAAFVGALFFGLHPTQVEPVAWISGLKDLLSGTFSLLSLRAYLCHSQNPQQWRALGSSLLFFSLAALSKPGTIVVPVLALCLGKLVAGTTWRFHASRLWPMALVAIPVAVLTKVSQPSANLTFVPPLWARPLVASDALTFYFSKVLVPLGLVPDYGRNPHVFLATAWPYVAWLVPVSLFIVLRRRRVATQVAFALFFVSLLPVLGLVPFYFQEFSTVADRYLYLALLGPALWLAWWVSSRPRAVRLVAMTLVLGTLCARAMNQTDHWRDSERIFEHTIRHNPDSILAHNNLGTILESRSHWVEAAYHYSEVLRIDPDNPAGHYNLARVFAFAGRFEKARDHYRKVLVRYPDMPDAETGMGVVSLKLGRIEEAQSYLFRSLALRPDHPPTLAQIGHVFQAKRDCDGAFRYYERALSLDPKLPEALLGKGHCYKSQGRKDLAERYLEAGKRARLAAG